MSFGQGSCRSWSLCRDLPCALPSPRVRLRRILRLPARRCSRQLNRRGRSISRRRRSPTCRRRMDDRAGHRAVARREVSRAHRRPRSAGPGAPQHHRDQSRRADDRRPARRRTQEPRTARPAARHPDRDQGQHRDRGPDDDDGRIARARGRQAARGCVHRHAAAKRRRRHPRQDEPERVGQLPIVALLERLERARRPDAGIRTRSIAVLPARARARRSPWRRTSRPRRSAPKPAGRSSRPAQANSARRHQADRRAFSAGAASCRSPTPRTRAGPMARTVADAAAAARRDGGAGSGRRGDDAADSAPTTTRRFSILTA